MLPLFRRRRLPFSPSLASSPNHQTLATTTTSSSSSSSSSSVPVAAFWDLDNKPPKSTPPYDAAVRLRLAASSFGPLRFLAAYASPRTLTPSPSPSPSLTCRLCARNFFAHSKLLNHFKTHEREHAKRLRRLDSSTGARYVRLKARLNFKMEKYRNAAREFLMPRVGYGLGDELQRAGVSVRIVGDDGPEAAHRALSEHVAETMDRRRVGCLVLVSDDAGFAGVIREARMRRFKTVVVGDDGDGALKRCADASFSWKEVVSGRARKEAASVVVRWNDRDLVRRLEWRYQYGSEMESGEGECDGSEWEDVGSGEKSVADGCGKRVSKPWWKLD